jgi:hypothetical protein
VDYFSSLLRRTQKSPDRADQDRRQAEHEGEVATDCPLRDGSKPDDLYIGGFSLSIRPFVFQIAARFIPSHQFNSYSRSAQISVPMELLAGTRAGN